MNNEFKTIKTDKETIFVLETTSGGTTSAASVGSGSVVKALGQPHKRITDEEADKVPQKPRQGPLRPQTGGGTHRDKKREQKQGQQKHRKPFMEYDLEEIHEPGHEPDHEISMANSQLLSIIEDAMRLIKIIKHYSEMEGLEAWQQSKLTKAADYLNAVLNNLQGKEIFQKEDHNDYGKGWGQKSYNTYAGTRHGRGVAEGSDAPYWRVEQSEATGRYYVVTGYTDKSRKVWKNILGAADFNKKENAEAKANELNQGMAEGIENNIDSMSIEELEQFVDRILPILQELSKQKSKTARDQFNQLKKQYDAALEKIYDVDSMNESTLQEKFKSKQGVAEAEKKPHPQTWHDVDKKLGKAVDKMSQAEKVKKGYAHPDTLKKKGVAEEKIKGADGKACWKGKRYAGTKNGKDICIPVGEEETNESGLLAWAGRRKHGKEYMNKASAAARKGASQEELGRLKDRYSKAEKVKEAEKKGLYYYVNKRKKAGTSRPASHPDAPSPQDWKNAAKTAKTEDVYINQLYASLNEKMQSQQQSKLMHAAANDPAVAKKTGVSQEVAREFVKASHGQKVSKLPKRVKKDK